jgi:hypothetical protein
MLHRHNTGHSSTGHLAEETDLIGSKLVKKKLYLGDTVAEAADGRVIGSSFGHFEMPTATPFISHASLGCRLSSNKNHHGSNIWHCVQENTTSPRNV